VAADSTKVRILLKQNVDFVRSNSSAMNSRPKSLFRSLFRASLPKFAFFPFGGGPRQCIGYGFAWLELMLVLAHFLRDWRFELVPGQKIELWPAVTLRSKHPIRVRVRRS
jgi:cytochrome P450